MDTSHGTYEITVQSEVVKKFKLLAEAKAWAEMCLQQTSKVCIRRAEDQKVWQWQDDKWKVQESVKAPPKAPKPPKATKATVPKETRTRA